MGFGGEQILQVGGTSVVDSSEHQEEEFEGDALVDGEPMERAEDWGDVF